MFVTYRKFHDNDNSGTKKYKANVLNKSNDLITGTCIKMFKTNLTCKNQCDSL